MAIPPLTRQPAFPQTQVTGSDAENPHSPRAPENLRPPRAAYHSTLNELQRKNAPTQSDSDNHDDYWKDDGNGGEQHTDSDGDTVRRVPINHIFQIRTDYSNLTFDEVLDWFEKSLKNPFGDFFSQIVMSKGGTQEEIEKAKKIGGIISDTLTLIGGKNAMRMRSLGVLIGKIRDYAAGRPSAPSLDDLQLLANNFKAEVHNSNLNPSRNVSSNSTTEQTDPNAQTSENINDQNPSNQNSVPEEEGNTPTPEAESNPRPSNNGGNEESVENINVDHTASSDNLAQYASTVRPPKPIPPNGIFSQRGTAYQGGGDVPHILGNDGNVYQARGFRTAKQNGTGYDSVDIVDPKRPFSPSKGKLYRVPGQSRWRTQQEVGNLGGVRPNPGSTQDHPTPMPKEKWDNLPKNNIPHDLQTNIGNAYEDFGEVYEVDNNGETKYLVHDADENIFINLEDNSTWTGPTEQDPSFYSYSNNMRWEVNKESVGTTEGYGYIYVDIDEVLPSRSDIRSSDMRTEAITKRIEQGQAVDPIDVYENPDGTFTVVNGNHRLQAANNLKLTMVPIRIRPAP